MGVSSGRSRVADLTFHVLGRSIHPDWFAVRAYKRVTRTGWEADVRIVEGGHAISWASGAIRLTEVLVGPETLLPEVGLLFHSHVKHERSTRLAPDSRVDYQTCFEAERLDAEVFAHVSQEIMLDASSGDLFHRFASTNRLTPSPISRIHIESRNRGLSIQAFHTFPEERAIVRVQSLFELVGE